MSLVALEESCNQRRFVEVFALLGILVDPQFGKHLFDLLGQKAREDGVTRILDRKSVV